VSPSVRSAASSLIGIVDPPEAVALGEVERFAEFRHGERPVQLGIVVSAITRAVLIHQVETGVARNLFGEEPHHLF
jgi:hypothetical protein